MLQSQGVTVPRDQQIHFKRKTPAKPAKAVKLPEPTLLREYSRFMLPGWTPTFLTAFRIIILVRFFAAMYSGIQDCDEVYNYWEPLHYLVKGTGFQTWEYSPEYSIRSYAYLLLHTVPAWIAQRLPDKVSTTYPPSRCLR